MLGWKNAKDVTWFMTMPLDKVVCPQIISLCLPMSSMDIAFCICIAEHFPSFKMLNLLAAL